MRVSGKSWKKIKRGLPIDLDKARLIPAIPDIIRNGEHQGRFPVDKPRQDGIVAFHFFEAPVEVGGKTYAVGVSVGEDAFGNLVYNLNRDPQALLEKRKAPILPRLEARGSGPSEGPDGTLNQSIDPFADGINLDLLAQGNQAARGAFNPATGTIALLKGADLSTFLHESGHHFLEVLADLASRPDAPDAITQDMETVLQWFGVGQTETAQGKVALSKEDRRLGEKLADMAARFKMTPRELVESWKQKAPRPSTEQGTLWAEMNGIPELALFAAENPGRLENYDKIEPVTIGGNAVARRPGQTPLDVWNRMTLDEKRLYHEQFARGFEAYLLEGHAPLFPAHAGMNRVQFRIVQESGSVPRTCGDKPRPPAAKRRSTPCSPHMRG